MIIVGTRVTTEVADRGHFYCPRCRDHQPYELLQPRRLFTLYWIPVLPMGKFEKYVECGGCRSQFKELVLQNSPVPALHKQVEIHAGSSTPKKHLEVLASPWEKKGNEIVRDYKLSGTQHSLLVVCRIERAPINTHAFFFFFLEPGLVDQETFLILRLTVAGDDPEGGFFAVRAGPDRDGATLLSPVERKDAQKCFALFHSGKEISFTLMDKAGVLVSSPLPNDLDFRSCCQKCQKDLR